MKKDTSIILSPVGDEKPSDAIYEQIRQMITDGVIAPGSRLPSERKMAEMIGRSRSTIREAMRKLEQDGYITTVSRSSGAIVKEPGVDVVIDSLENVIQMQNLKFTDILEFRHFTETSAAALACQRRTPENLEHFRDILARSSEAVGDAAAFTSCDVEFHMEIARAAQNDMYVIMLNVCRSVLQERLSETLLQDSAGGNLKRYQNILAMHTSIFEAIRIQDAEEAQRLIEEHLYDAGRAILN